MSLKHNRIFIISTSAALGAVLLSLFFIKTVVVKEDTAHLTLYTQEKRGDGEYLEYENLQPGEEIVVTEMVIPDRGETRAWEYHIKGAGQEDDFIAFFGDVDWKPNQEFGFKQGTRSIVGKLSDTERRGLQIISRQLRNIRPRQVGFGYETYKLEYFSMGKRIGVERFLDSGLLLSQIAFLSEKRMRGNPVDDNVYQKLRSQYETSLSADEIKRMVTPRMIADRLLATETKGS